MVMQVNQELCAGCGACMEACPVGAIHLMDQCAAIDDGLCTQCEACMDACPSGAITALSVPARSTPVVALSTIENRIVPAPKQTVLPETVTPTIGVVSLTGAALAFLGREVAPRLVDVLINVLERRLERPTMTATAPLATSNRGFGKQGRGVRRQARYRGGRNYTGNHKERR
jgi:NAD-dependent dihydropyrimidine dehydrogenase PreA subunit